MLSHQASRSPTVYNGFDNIAEPGRRAQPMFLRRTKARRSKFAILGAVLCVLLLVWGWKSSGINLAPKLSNLPSLTLASTNQTPIASSPPKPPKGQNSTERTSFHLIIPASKSNQEFCKTLLSSFVLGYPAPTLVNWGKASGKGGMFEESAIHTAKIKGIYNFLKDPKQVKDEDLVLIVDGYDVWFQLPPHILVSRYHSLIEDANQRLKSRYGMVGQDQNGDNLPEQVPRYTQNVVFGADKICWPNSQEDPACAAVPYSTLPKDVYGADTDKDPEAYHNRPRFLNSGTVMGRAKNVRDVYRLAVERFEKDHQDALGDQYFFNMIFGEQEFQRETLRRAALGAGGRWLNWLSDTLGMSDSPLAANVTINNVTAVEGQRYEYGIGLDYESRIFQTMTHSADDVEFISYNSSTEVMSDHDQHHHSLPLFLPPDLQSARPPFYYASPGNRTADSDPSRKGILLPYTPSLDNLPDRAPGVSGPSWRDVPLATNVYSASVPALLHVNGDKGLLEWWWDKIWFFPFGRALLRRFIRSTQTLEAAIAADNGGVNWWDMRGGRGGVWTDQRVWMDWSEVCKGTEGEVFRDDKGTWGKEQGDGKETNEFGKLMVTGFVADYEDEAQQ